MIQYRVKNVTGASVPGSAMRVATFDLPSRTPARNFPECHADAAHLPMEPDGLAGDTRTRLLDDLSSRALSALHAAFIAFRLLLGHGDSNAVATDTVARLNPGTAELFEPAWRTAALLIKRTMFADLDASLEIEADRRDLEAAIAEVDANCDAITVIHGTPELDELVKRVVTAAHEDAEHFLTDVAIEECDAELGLALDENDAPFLVWRFVSREHAMLSVLLSVLSSVEYMATANEITTAEVEAAALWITGRMVKPEEDRDKLTAIIRAKEWVLGDHRSILLENTLADALIQSPEFERLPAKHRAMATALARSRASLYIVRDVDGNRITLEDFADNSRVVMHEHAAGAEYEVGDFTAGRVYDIGGGTLLRSPGMYVFSLLRGDNYGMESPIGPAFRMLVEDRGDISVATELALRMGLDQETLEDVEGAMDPPELTKDAARERLAVLTKLLREAGLMEKLDEPMTDFLEALERQAEDA